VTSIHLQCTVYSKKDTMTHSIVIKLMLLICLYKGRILLVGVRANIEDGSSLIIHWSSGSQIQDQRTGLINTTFILGTVLYDIVWYSQHVCHLLFMLGLSRLIFKNY